MSIFSWIFGQLLGHAKPAPSGPTVEDRRALLASAVRDTLRHHGIPLNWIGAETLPAKAPSEHRAVHLRLVVRNGTPQLLAHVFALQHAIHARLSQLDAESARWVTGTSWRMDVPLGTEAIELPGPEFWQPSRRSHPAAAKASQRDPLWRSLSAGESAFARPSADIPEFTPTQPMGVR